MVASQNCGVTLEALTGCFGSEDEKFEQNDGEIVIQDENQKIDTVRSPEMDDFVH